MIHALHGNFGLPSDWDASLPAGIPAKAWHLWEIRRHHPEAGTLTGFATWFNHQIQALPPDPQRVLAGYSLGGRLALHVLLDRPQLWHRVLIISAHPGLKSEDERGQRLEHDLNWKQRCLTQTFESTLQEWNQQPVLQDSPEAENRAPELQEWQNEIASAFDGWSLGNQRNLLPDLGPVACCGLWLTGADDAKFVDLAQHALTSLPGFTGSLVPGAGHRILHEASAATRQLLFSLADAS